MKKVVTSLVFALCHSNITSPIITTNDEKVTEPHRSPA
ncbi:hypothetical protein H4683_002191 [Filibacter limicola]|uniref:Uncharacterized protein n=1 Tax=Sporosarcina limicola TaxID=34101 RepID=A0A927RF13_9BACL|nr:hypothetical protein [Sporosarcina limicola]